MEYQHGEDSKETFETSFPPESIKILYDGYMKDIYVVVIRPTLEYGVLVWNGGIVNDLSKAIERIQKHLLKIIYGKDDYDKVFQTAKLASLKERRDGMCIQLIKSMSNPDHKWHNLLP